MTLYGVLSPRYPYTEIIDSEIGGPTYDVAAYVELDAPSARDAKVLAIKMREFEEWVDLQRGDRACPFTGVKVFVLPECMADPMHDGCEKCLPAQDALSGE